MGKKSETPVVRALDLGFGFTKYSKASLKNDYDLEVSAFASFAGRSADSESIGQALGSLDILTIEVDGVPYTVGNDSKLAASGQARQLLEPSFFLSPQYLAIARGALTFMAVPEDGVIDELVVGLPLNIYGNEPIRSSVVTKLQSTHSVPSVQGRRDIHVRNVTILPQIMGSLIALSAPSGRLAEIQHETNLTIDVGYGTLLWLVTSGMKPNPMRSNGNMGGVSSILRAIATAIDNGASNNVGILDRLDKALYSNLPTVKVDGATVKLADYKQHQNAVVAENLTELLSSIGNRRDIDNIFLTGGGSEFYRPAIQAAFPGRVFPSTNLGGRFTNVLGFQIFGERKVR